MTDLRPIYFREARERLVGNRLAVYVALQAAPATGTELAAKMGWPVTSVRPRLVELRQMNAVNTTGIRRNGEHEWRALTAAETAAANEKTYTVAKVKINDTEGQPVTYEAVLHAGGYVGKQLNLI